MESSGGEQLRRECYTGGRFSQRSACPGMKKIVKNCLHAASLALALPLAAIAGFGRFPPAFALTAQTCALFPGVVGDYIRIAFYKLTLKQCSLYSRVSFGSFFAHPNVVLGRGVYIGPYCVLGRCSIGERTQIASQVQILSGRRQHRRELSGQISGADEVDFEVIEIGADCWIGASSIIMAAVGSGTTIGAGAVVVRPIASQVVAVGNPARVIKEGCPESRE
jgi:virginiamycin A acetyltransferase